MLWMHELSNFQFVRKVFACVGTDKFRFLFDYERVIDLLNVEK